MKKLARLLVILLCLTTFQNYAKAGSDEKIKFGKISMDEMTATVCPIDSNAYAYVIADIGTTTFRYAETTIRSDDPQSGRKGYQLDFERLRRIKLLKKEGFDYADVEIPLYQDGDDKEKLLGIKAFTYNLVDGKIEKTKLDSKDILTEQTSENRTTVKFAMPNLQEGSVIEISYEIQSDFYFNLQEWYFQKNIPTLYSEYYVAIPEYFSYNQSMKGYFPIHTDQDRRQQKLTLKFIQKDEGLSNGYTYTKDYDYIENVFVYHAKDIPAFPNEKFLHTRENYLSKIEFELAYTKFPNSTMQYFSTSWEAIDNKLKESYSFGRELGRANHLDEAVAALKGTGLQGVDLMGASLKFMQQKMSWNGKKTLWVNTTLNKAYKEGEGNAADINLNLVNLLNELGFNAHPLLLSTQEHGLILLGRPSLTRFNYVIAYVDMGDSYFLMDATDPNSTINLLPIRCLNDKGRVYGYGDNQWIELHSAQPYVSKSFAVLELDKDLNISGQVKKRLEGYAAYSFKTEAKKASDMEELVKTFEDENSKLNISDVEIPPVDSMGMKIQIGYKLASNDLLMNAGDMVYLNANYEPFFNENPLKLDKRDFPVEFDYPMALQRSCTIKIPEGVAISELPKSVNIQLPNAAGNFVFQCVNNMGMVQINTSLNIKKDLFLPDEYDILKQFIQAVIEKQNEMLVLKAI